MEQLRGLPPLSPALPEEMEVFDRGEAVQVDGLPEGVQIRTTQGGLVTYIYSEVTRRLKCIPLASDDAEYLVKQAQSMLEAERRYQEEGILGGGL